MPYEPSTKIESVTTTDKKLRNIYLRTLKALRKQQDTFTESMLKTSIIYDDIALDRKNHVHAIGTARHKNIYDHVTEYQTFVLETQGKAEMKSFYMK